MLIWCDLRMQVGERNFEPDLSTYQRKAVNTFRDATQYALTQGHEEMRESDSETATI